MAPHTPPAFTFRPVRTQLLAGLEHQQALPKLLLLVAPVGYGKTVLMASLHSHVQAAGSGVFWIGLGDRHHSADRVLEALLEAFARPRTEIHPTQVLLSGKQKLEDQVEDLLTELSARTEPTTVFIDNLDSCQDEALAPVLNALVFRTPGGVRFVWSSTAEPHFDGARAKLEGLVHRVGFERLSLARDEVSELLGEELSQRIGTAGVESVRQRTEGWPAAVRLAQIVLASSDNPTAAVQSFSGSDEDIAALLNRQVLGHFDASLREFLLCVSLLRWFSIALCREAIDDKQAQEHVELLLRRNVLVVPLDRNRSRYRLHGLFREHLAVEAGMHLDPARRDEVLRKASAW